MKTAGQTGRQRSSSEPSESIRSSAGNKARKLLQDARRAGDPATALELAQRAADLSPDDPQVQASLQQVVLGRLRKDAFVAFMAETDKHYVITFRNSRPVVIPKARAKPEAYPPPRASDGEHALSMLWWLVLGLLPAGIGAMILSPLVVSRGVDVLFRRGADGRDRRLAWVAILLAGLLGCVGMIFSLLLAIHLVR